MTKNVVLIDVVLLPYANLEIVMNINNNLISKELIDKMILHGNFM